MTAGTVQRQIDLRAGGARALWLSALALGGMLIATAVACAQGPAQPLPSAAVFGPHLERPDLPWTEITLTRPGYHGVVLVLTRNSVSRAADGFSIYIMNEIATGGLYCHIWIPGNASKQIFDEGDVTAETPMIGQAYALMGGLAATVDAITRDLAPKSIGFGVIRSVPETIYQRLGTVRAMSGGSN